eukprot:scaffold22001_cov141-Skeletonema_marinoi.AAC.2
MQAAVCDASSGHLRRCSDLDTEDMDCHIRCVRYDIVLESNAGGRLAYKELDVRYDIVLESNAGGHLILDLIRSPTTL